MFHRSLACSLVVGILGSLAACGPRAPEAPAVRDTAWFLQKMRTVDHLPDLEDSHTAMTSTWDRTGGNGDGTDFKDIRKDGPGVLTKNVLFDASGPACIHRIFVGLLGPEQEGTRIQLFLDGAETPVFDMPILEFFDYRNGPLPYPLVFRKSYPGTLFPIPFEKHCRIQLVNPKFGQPGWSDRAWSNYWQVVYTRYPESVKIRSLTWPLDAREKTELNETCRAWLQAECSRPQKPETWSVEKTTALAPGATLPVKLEGAGEVRQLRVRVDPATPNTLGSLRMRISWDGAPSPSVDVPIGSFFGNTNSAYNKSLGSTAAVMDKDAPIEMDPPVVAYTPRFDSLLLGADEEDAYCRFPMPFANGATLEFANTGDEAIQGLRVRLDVVGLREIAPNRGRFHATWTQSRAAMEDTPKFGAQNVPGKIVLDRQGRGKYVGVMLSIDWPYLPWWGEGDWLIWSDQEGWPPDYHGTGSEEYFNSGWCRFDRKAVSGFVMLRPGHPTVYSFHLNDAFQFRKSIKVVEEQMGDDLIQQKHPLWTTTAFWYGLPAQPAGSDR
jgi:hypothetical protein